VENAVTTAFGAPVTLTFRADPAILAGIELNAPHAFIRSSWREDLDRIRDELSRDHATTE
ncbi:MAG: F0F1 ATP synthase subunit B, partial [Alphaproteobacteria bacterium]|nr:F0F1 ATP synthase subunit B [Alphaproteobacteria bacterium]